MTESRPTRRVARVLHAITMLALLVLTGCGGSDGDSPVAPTPEAPGREITTTGGRVDGPDGARLEVPAGALQAPARIEIAKDATLAPPLPADSGMRLASNVFSITPHGQGFAAPVRVRLPFDATQVGRDEQLVLLKAAPGGEWRVHTDVTRDGAFASAEVRDFSVFAFAARVRAPFSFRVAVSGTTPQLRVSYTFSGTVPVCRFGLEVQTVFRYRLESYWSNTWWIGIGWGGNSGTSTSLHDQQVLEVPGGIAGAEQGHDVLQPMLPAPVAGTYGGPSSTWEYQYYPVLTARVVCRGEEFVAGPGGGVTVAPLTWTYQAENTIDLDQHQGPLALIEDIGDIEATVGQPSASHAKVQMRSDWGASLFANSRWMIRRSDAQAWSELSRADRLEALPMPGQIQEPWTSLPPARPLNSLVRLGTTLADPSPADDGAQVRLVACVDPALASSNCVTGATRRLRFSATAVAPFFTRQPAGAVVPVGLPISFVAAATGAPAPALQWQRFDGTAWVDVAGATASQLTITAPARADDGTLLRLLASNSAGTATSAVVRLNVVDQAAPPVVAAISGDLAVARGGSAVFAAQVSGTAPLSYQWYRYGTPITGANTPILRLDDVQGGASGSYELEVSNPAGRSRSAAMALSVTSGAPVVVAPQVTTQPVATTVGTGHTATFAVAVSGTGPFAFQWYRDGQPIAGATAAAYTIASVSAADQASYTVTISNPAGSAVSDAAALTVQSGSSTPVAPMIGTQPAPVVVMPGGSVTLAVAASGSAPLSYQWTRDGVDIIGAIGPVLTLSAVGSSDAGTYAVRVANSAGSVVSSEAAVMILGLPSISGQPSPATVIAGQSATFSVAALGSQLRYLWLRNGVVVAGATGASYTTPQLAPTDSGAVYSVVVFNGAGAQVSAPALLTVTPPAATGVLLAHEGFTYTLGDNLAGKSGGSGWSGAWTATDGYLSPLAASASGTIVAGLGYTDSGGRRLLASGGAWSSSAGVFFGQIQRASVDKPGAAGSTRWLSMIVRQDAPPTGINYVMAAPGRGWSFGSSATAMAAGIGGTGVFVNCWYCSGTPATAPIAGWAQGSTALLLVRVDFAVSGNDTVSLWINPTLDPAVDIGAPTATASLSNFAELLDGVTVGWGDFRSFTVDELRIGTGRTAVLPIATP